MCLIFHYSTCFVTAEVLCESIYLTVDPYMRSVNLVLSNSECLSIGLRSDFIVKLSVFSRQCLDRPVPSERRIFLFKISLSVRVIKTCNGEFPPGTLVLAFTGWRCVCRQRRCRSDRIDCRPIGQTQSNSRSLFCLSAIKQTLSFRV